MSSAKEFSNVELEAEKNSNLELQKELDKTNDYVNRLQRLVHHWSERAVVAEKQDAFIDDLAKRVSFYRNRARKAEAKLKDAKERTQVAESATRLYQEDMRDRRKKRIDRLEQEFEVRREG